MPKYTHTENEIYWATARIVAAYRKGELERVAERIADDGDKADDVRLALEVLAEKIEERRQGA